MSKKKVDYEHYCYYGQILNKNTRKWIIKRLPQDFYEKFARQLCENFDWSSRALTDYYNINAVEGTVGWGNALRDVCAKNPQYEWVHDIIKFINWIDFDILNGDIGWHIHLMARKGKL